MKDNKRVKVLLKVIQRVYNKNPEMQEAIKVLIIEVSAEEGVSPQHIFFYFAFSLLLSLS